MSTNIKKKIWQRYAPLYAKITPTFQKELLKFISGRAFGDVLDAGCGVGKNLEYLLSNPTVKSILAIDMSEFMLEEARKRYVLNHDIPLKIELGDITQLEAKRGFQFDSICSVNVVYTLDNPIEFLKKTYQLLRNNGRLLLSSQNRDVSLEDFKKVLDKEFNNSQTSRNLIDCNRTLTGYNSAPRQYSNPEVRSILEMIGFKIEEERDDFYLGNNFTFVVRKP